MFRKINLKEKIRKWDIESERKENEREYYEEDYLDCEEDVYVVYSR